MTLRKAALLLLALSLGTCNQAIMIAPPGSNLTLTANPPAIAAHGDVSVITAFVTKATGIPVADGTVVQFFTTLGRIDEQGKTNDGVARVNLVSDSRSGTAQVTGVSGGEATTGTPSPSPSPSPGGNAEPATGFASAMSVTGASSVSAATASSMTIPVIIGTGRTLHVIVTAVPRRITPGRTAQIIAVVFDDSGNPVPNVPIVFTVTGGQGTESLDSQGRSVFTDNNGQATDVLRTRATVAGEVTVHATPSKGTEGTVIVEVGPV